VRFSFVFFSFSPGIFPVSCLACFLFLRLGFQPSFPPLCVCPFVSPFFFEHNLFDFPSSIFLRCPPFVLASVEWPLQQPFRELRPGSSLVTFPPLVPQTAGFRTRNSLFFGSSVGLFSPVPQHFPTFLLLFLIAILSFFLNFSPEYLFSASRTRTQ